MLILPLEMFRFGLIIIAAGLVFVGGNTVQRGQNIVLAPHSYIYDQFACSMDNGDCPWSTKPIIMDFTMLRRCNTADYNVNMNFQGTDLISFIVVSGGPYDPYASPLLYIKELSVLRQSHYRGYNTYYSDTSESPLTYTFRNDAVNNSITFNYTVDLCCNGDCGINENAAMKKNSISYLIFLAVMIGIMR